MLPTVAEVRLNREGHLVIRPLRGKTLTLPKVVEVHSQADGSFSLEPFQEWITAAKAGEILDLSEASIFRLFDLCYPEGKPLLEVDRRSPRKTRLSLASVLELKARRQAVGFWKNCRAVAKPVQEQCKGIPLKRS
jgi:hypothetical protein